MPDLIERPVYDRYKKQSAHEGVHVYDKTGQEVLSKVATVLPDIMA